MKYHYVFESKDIESFKYCPYCRADLVEIYTGDYTGWWTCAECDEDPNFNILEEMLDRFPDWIKKFKDG